MSSSATRSTSGLDGAWALGSYGPMPSTCDALNTWCSLPLRKAPPSASSGILPARASCSALWSVTTPPPSGSRTYQLQNSTVASALSPHLTCQPASRAWLNVHHLGSSSPSRLIAAASTSLF